MTQATIRPARLADAEALHRHCYPGLTLGAVRDYLAWCLRQAERGRIVRLVADLDGQAVGNVQLTAWGEVGEIGSLVVGASFRRQGLAGKLLAAAIAKARQAGLRAVEIGVQADQPAILDFYRRMGFQPERGLKRELSHSRSPAPLLQLRMQL